VWAILCAGSVADWWYSPNYLFGAFILFGIASYLGCYTISLFVKKAAFAIAAGVHLLLYILYIISYVANQQTDSPDKHRIYSALQYGLGLTSPAANLGRALWVGSNSFQVLCGKYGTADTSSAFAFVRYGSPYAYLLLQIVFLIMFLGIYEYGSADWLRRTFSTRRGQPARLHTIIEESKIVSVHFPHKLL
jgi:ATP-binding cassette subfamily A (ABC1) protein 3